MVKTETLDAIYNRWLEREGLPRMSADELQCELMNQLDWIGRFLEVYENAR